MPPPPPRPFRLGSIDPGAKSQLGFGVLWSAVAGAVCVGFLSTGGPPLGDIALDRHGLQAQAVATSIERTNLTVNDQPVWRVSFNFKDGAGVPYKASTTSRDPSFLARAWRKEPIAIEYDPRDPTLTRIAGGSVSAVGALILVPFAFAVVCAIIAAIGLRRAIRVHAIYVHGQAVAATVTDVAPTRAWVNDRPIMRIHYMFETSARRVTGRIDSANPPAVGASIWVIHASSEPERNLALLR